MPRQGKTPNKKLIEWRALRNNCKHYNDLYCTNSSLHSNQKKYRFRGEQVGDCGLRDCPIWKRLKDIPNG